MNTNTKFQPLQNTQQTDFNAGDFLKQSRKSIENTITSMSYGRIVITFILIGWLITFTYLIMKKDEIKPDDSEYQRWFMLHRTWFGDESIVMILWKVWYYTLLLLTLSPLIREIVSFMRLKVYL